MNIYKNVFKYLCTYISECWRISNMITQNCSSLTEIINSLNTENIVFLYEPQQYEQNKEHRQKTEGSLDEDQLHAVMEQHDTTNMKLTLQNEPTVTRLNDNQETTPARQELTKLIIKNSCFIKQQ